MTSTAYIRKCTRTKFRANSENSINEIAIDNDNERRNRRSVYNAENGVASTTEHCSIALMDMEQIKNHIKMCQKLFYENKINIHNAWNVRIIDYINRYVSNNKIDAETILMAATTLDICVKVYGFKLEYLGKEIMKLVQAIQPTKVTQNDDAIAADSVLDVSKDKQKRRRRSRRSICTIVKDKNSLLCKEIPKVLSVNFMESLDIYASSSENMFINRVPMDHAVYKFTLMNNVENGFPSYEGNDQILREEQLSITFPKVNALSICPQFRNFNVDEIDDLYSEVSSLNNDLEADLNPVNNEVVYDDDGFPVPELDGSIHDIFEEEIAPVGHVAQTRVEMITSLSPVNESVRKASELSSRGRAALDSVWVGPSHWKNKLVRPVVVKFSGKVNNEAPPPAKRRRKTSEHEDFIDFVGSVTDIDVNKKITKTISLDIDKCTLPLNDVCSVPDFDILNESHLIPTKEYHLSINEIQLEPEVEQDCPQADFLENDNSMEMIDNDTSNIDETIPDNVLEENNNIACSTSIKRNNVFGSDIDVQTYVPYAIRTKRINMKKLKKVMWECLVENEKNSTNVRKIRELRPSTSITFSTIYKKLHAKLPSEIRTEISVPLAFFCLLHLTNENNLKLTGFPNLNDVKID